MKYRPDIDGLRSIAVITIMFFHYGIPGFEGAFAGPEVFFVLSGFLIATKIFEKTEIGQFDFKDFYYKRMRRLFPAYAVMMVVTLLMAYYWMLPADFKDFSKSFAASTVYLSNIQFYRESGYFDVASHLKPLLHTWSLSVEEQFYLVFPLTAVLLGRMKRKQLFYIFLIISGISFLAAVLTMRVDVSRVFYLFPYRVWELGLGVMLATGCYHLPKTYAHWKNELLAMFAIGLIIVPMALYDPSMAFPGMAALPACIGTWIIIQLDSQKLTLVQRFLSLKIMTFIGALSYSLYLWHWPIYVMYKYTDTNGIDAIELVGIISVVFIISYISYKYIEEPLRKGKVFFVKTKTAVFASASIFSVVFILVGLFIYSQEGMPERFDESIRPAIEATHIFGDMNDCVELDNSELEDLSYCSIGSPLASKDYTLILGDSHSPTYRFALKSLMPNLDALIVWSGGCPPVFDVEVDEKVASKDVEQACINRNVAVKELIKNDKRISSVILLGRWSYYGHGVGVGIDSGNEIKIWPKGEVYNKDNEQYQVFLERFEKTINYINSQGQKIFVIEQPPEIANFNARKLVIDQIVGKTYEVEEQTQLMTVSIEDVQKRQGPMQEKLQQLHERGDVEILSTHKFLCGETHCSAIYKNSPLYFDNNHLSSLKVAHIKDMFKPFYFFNNHNR